MARIGLFICDCGGTLAKTVNFDDVASWAEKSGRFAFVARHSDLCGEQGLRELEAKIKEEGVDRVVVAACSPKVKGEELARSVEAAGLSRYNLVVANIREQCAWAHPSHPMEATEKAKALINAAASRAEKLDDVPVKSVPITQRALVIGGGISGITAAQELAELGFDVTIVERQPTLGGLCLKLGTVFPTNDCSLCVRTTACPALGGDSTRKCIYRSAIEVDPRIQVLTNAEVVDVMGEVGNFNVIVKKKPRYVSDACINCGACAEVCPVSVPDEFNLGLSERKAIYLPFPQAIPPIYVIDPENCKFKECGKCVEACPVNAINLDEKEETLTINAGTIIVATGFEEYDPRRLTEYGYGKLPDVVTQVDLARLLDITGPTGGRLLRVSDGRPVERIVMIQCAGSRDENHNFYCSNICCMIALKHAVMIKKRFPEVDVVIAYMDIRPVGSRYEEYYREARELGVTFIRGKPASVVPGENGKLIVDVENTLAGEYNRVEADMVALSMAMVPSRGTQELARILGVKLGPDGYVEALDRKVRPAETNVAGIFVAGAAMTPMDIPYSITHASSAAIMAARLMKKGSIEKPLLTAVVNEDTCGKCQVCQWACPFNAITVEEDKSAVVTEAKCFGCGLCAGACPTESIQLRNHTDEQIMASIEGVSADGVKPNIVVIACYECGYSAIDYAGMLGMEYPANVKVIGVPCTAVVDPQEILRALANGVDGIMIVGCFEERCHFSRGAKVAGARVALLRAMLSQLGVNPQRLQMVNVDCAEADKFVTAAKQMIQEVQQ
ncbi:MAG: FAD-dependent oxidoreductase [Candidatus Freyarchaeota archaeon]|nr:hydrogenase iron-sulfur subunit [Candidatus Freyrarchaeum guaymaensis]